MAPRAAVLEPQQRAIMPLVFFIPSGQTAASRQCCPCRMAAQNHGQCAQMPHHSPHKGQRQQHRVHAAQYAKRAVGQLLQRRIVGRILARFSGIMQDERIPVEVNSPTWAEPAQRYCPAGVFEVLEMEGAAKLQINAANCIHCKTCDIKDPSQNIIWTPPQGDPGPLSEYVMKRGSGNSSPS